MINAVKACFLFINIIIINYKVLKYKQEVQRQKNYIKFNGSGGYLQQLYIKILYLILNFVG